MLQRVDVGTRTLQAYRGIAPSELLDEVIAVAEHLRGARVLHINATPYGGGVSELLRSLVPLLEDLGLIAHWQVIRGNSHFFEVTKAIHNALQGAERGLSDSERGIYLADTERNAKLLEGEYDFVFVHDPQPAALLPLAGFEGNCVWRCHIDTSNPNQQVWRFLKQFLCQYDATVFTMREFIPHDLPVAHVEIIPPAIDPLSPKNLFLPESMARQILDWIGIETNRPLITQVSRFDLWKDPLGVVEAYREVHKESPQLQLALVGSMALDDPEGWEVYRELTEQTADEPLIHIFTNLTGVSNIEVNAFQRLSDIVVQKSIREGFGLVVSESMWKGTPVVAGRAGGIPLQMADSTGGILIDNVEECAQAITHLLNNPQLAEELGRQGHERVHEYFLLPRLLLNELTLMRHLSTPRLPDVGQLDPVCGMAVSTYTAISARLDGQHYSFCSERCRAHFLKNPSLYESVTTS